MIQTSDAEAVGSQTTPTRVLVIARDDQAGASLCEALQEVGIEWTAAVSDGRRALPAFREAEPDVVVLDALIDQLDAVAVINQLSARVPADRFMPFVVLAPPPAPARFRRLCGDRAQVFFQDFANPAGVALLVRELVSMRANGLQRSSTTARLSADAQQLEEDVARNLARFAELKDHPDSGHVFRVGHLSSLIALLLGVAPDEVAMIKLAAPLHDVGKIGIPDAILLKDEPLSLEELDQVKTHTTMGAAILAGASTRLLQLAEEIALYHHENWDGTGYTPGLEGLSIPQAARIVRVADAFDSVTCSRPFAEPWLRDNAIEFIRDHAGRSFDPDVVDAFLAVVEEAGESAVELAREVV